MIDFSPESLEAEVIQNVRTILATRRGSVPLDRALGISWDHLDAPMPIAKMHTMSDVIDALRVSEPRAVIQAVDIGGSEGTALEGTLPVTVRFTLDGQEFVVSA
jgi:phage baseplate assembly protein W